MRKTTLGLVVVAVLALGGGAAIAQPDGDWQRECFGPGPVTMEEAQQGCVKYEGGEWEPAGGRRGVLSDPESMFGTFVFIGILLGLVPAFAGLTIAPSANLSPGAGFGIGLVGSWVGVIGMYLYGHHQKRTAPAVGTGPAVESGETRAAEPSNAADRLRTLKDLLDQGLITQEEYLRRRQAAVDSL